MNRFQKLLLGILTVGALSFGWRGQAQFTQPNTDATIVVSDITTNNVSTTAHGFAPKAPNSTGQFLRGDATWATDWTVITTTSTGTQNNFAPGLIGNTILRANNASLLTITGVAAGFDGQLLTIVTINSAGQVDLPHNSVSSSAANRFVNFATSGNTSLSAAANLGGSATYQYSTTDAIWRLIQHEQGGWITPTFAGGSYTGSSNTWTVAAGDVTTQAYMLRGHTLTVAFSLVTTSITGGTILTLQIGNAAWGGFTATKEIYGLMDYSDAGANNQVGRVGITAAGTTLSLIRLSGTGNFSLSADLTPLRGEITFEVQ